MASSTNPRPLWWESLSDDVECAITLEPINTLPYPPFILRKPSASNEEVLYYFDGRALASYIVSRGIFQNPLTRDPLNYEDCRRLDEYLDAYGTENFQVLEAFALRESVQVRTQQHRSGNSAMDEARQRRSDFLRSEAAAALSGLFNYNSDVRSNRRAKRSNHDRISQAVANNRSNTQSIPRTFGFNLHAKDNKNDSNDSKDDYGMIVIDDDAAVQEEAEEVEFRQLQEAFPRLSTQSEGPKITTPSGDDRVVQKIKDLAEQERLQEMVRQQALEWAKSQLEKEARQRKEDMSKKKQAAKQRAEEINRQEQQEQEEIKRAREEIEAWRDAHWKRLREIADQKEERERLKREAEQKILAEVEAAKEEGSKESASREENQELLDQEKEAKQKAAKAAKKKRAKERKKAQKEQERKEQEEKARQAAIQAEKEASKKKCAACKDGILGSGFEKFGHEFCSPKCARAGLSS